MPQSSHIACRPTKTRTLEYNDYLEPEEVVLRDLVVGLVRVQDDRKSEPRVGAVTPTKLLVFLLCGLRGDAYMMSTSKFRKKFSPRDCTALAV